MAAPTLQAEGTIAVSTSGSVSPTIPTHQTDDILVCAVTIWAPNTASAIADIPTPSGWTKADSQLFFVDIVRDGEIAWFWRRATGAGTTVTFTRGSGWDTGTDTNFSARAYVIRGCITSGNPWDALASTQGVNANGNAPAVTVSGSERTVIQFLTRQDDYVTAPSMSGWTAGTAVETTTGTDASFHTFRKANVSSSTTGDAITQEDVAASGAGWACVGVSFKPPATGDNWTATPSDTITLSDSAAKAISPAKADTITLSDARSQAWTILRSAADTVTLSDAPGKGFTKPAADTITLSDEPVKKPGLNPADTVSLSDSFTEVWAIIRTAADTVTLSDLAAKGYGAAKADQISLSDNLTPLIVKVLELADSLSLSDAISKQPGLGRADTISLSDGFAKAWAAVRALADSLAMSDAVGKGIAHALADTIGTSDALGKGEVLAKADSISLADAIGKTYGISRTDSLALSDALVKGLGLQPSDTISLGDALTQLFTLVRADTLSLSDAANPVLTPEGGPGLTQNLADTITLTDVAVKALGLGKADILAMADSTARQLNGLFIDGSPGISSGAVRTIFIDRFGIH
jgi:hypothetical protein